MGYLWLNEKYTEYDFEELQVGQTVKFSLQVNSSIVENFAMLSGDYNPLHMDEEYAKTTKFGKRLCHGMLLSSFFSRLVGMYLPGKKALFFSQTLNFRQPCFLDDYITIEGEILDKSASTRMITLRTGIYNQDGKCLVDGTAKVIVQ